MITKKQLGNFDALEIFSDEYIKVSYNNKYNLIDRNGHFVSGEWFDSIEKKAGGADYIINGQTRRCQNVEAIGKSLQIGRMISNSAVLSAIDIDHVTIIPVKVITIKDKSVRLIALVDFYGEALFLSEDGRLFTEDYKPYIIPAFSISHTDICRLDKAVKVLCRLLNSEYRNDMFEEDDTKLMPVWAFGFGTQDKEFCTCHKRLISKPGCRPWGNDTIKLRFNVTDIKSIDTEVIKEWLEKNSFKPKNACFRGINQEWYTKQFEPGKIDELFELIESLKKDFNLVG